ncbi:TAT-variant-translocated molybdopterin oxidoreductase [Novosphingobium sp. 9U]|uniref:TAT-variant-translocated molybdopterin oxidoreductase n=1 Tax=Novosphingobium sp. 9U TaxID=2653158 RepID=UPI0012F2E3D6|nr:TAT-variant-translocated molybdopterin oxidoreductase [Novosphingobium sp. 9U]VWX47358.1 conserved hypothetical protein [Novosphingobium sp. 9U]
MTGLPDMSAGLEQLRASRGRHYWRSLEELFDTAEFRARVAREFPALARTRIETDRRSFFKCLAGAIALAGLDGCERKADEDAWPMVRVREGAEPGAIQKYATAWELDGVGQPVIGTCRDGRPIKLEGNPDHPASGGASDAFTQASLLGLYDPARSGAPMQGSDASTWDDVAALFQSERAALDSSGGAGFRLLTGPVGSPTLLRQIAAMRARWPQMRWHVHDPLGGVPEPVLHLDNAHVAVCFDADPLGNGPRQTWHARGWSARRRAFQQGEGSALLYAAEPTPTLTGVTATERLIAAHSRVPVLLAGLAARLGQGAPVALEAREAAWLDAAAAALRANRGKGLVCVGAQHGAEAAGLAARLNGALGNEGKAVTPAISATASEGLQELIGAMRAGQVRTLLVLESNPAYSAPAALGFAQALERVPLRLHAGLHRDETAQLCHWHLPLSHMLESWSDVRCAEGTVSLTQPLVRPFLDVRSRHEVLALLMDGARAGRDLVRGTWSGDEAQWQAALVKGVIEAKPLPFRGGVGVGPLAAEQGVGTKAHTPSPSPDGEGRGAGPRLELIFRPDPTIHDGQFAANPWLQEMPKPLTKLTWDNAVHLSPQLAARLGVGNEDLVSISAGGRTLVGPAWIVPGQEAQTILVHLGYGRRAGGQVAEGCGFDAYPLRDPRQPWARSDVSIRKASGERQLACTQTHWELGGHDWIRSVDKPGETLAKTKEEKEQRNFFKPQQRSEPAWGMAIDLDLCIGCNACAVACVAENNVPMVGREQVAKGREMHWLRIDRYYEGPAEEPRQSFQPVPCMHCEDAPCETGCPVNATVHSPDGLNLQVYNRCIGTRTCSAYCPYKVRRFNWLDYTREAEPEIVAQRNPDVTVRDRGVMEKCTYCIQRIAEARITADKDGRPIAEGEVLTACQQACPTQAIVFGDIARPDSAVSQRKADGRDYALLEDANTRPRTTYGAKIESGDA